MKQWTAMFVLFALLALPAAADQFEGVFEPDDHCVAYHSIKDMLFARDVVVVGLSCKVTAAVVPSSDGAGPRVVVEVPVKSLKSGNFLRDSSVSGILGAKIQPELRFSSDPLDMEALRRDIESGSFVVNGQLTIAGVDYAISSPVEVVEFEGQRYVRGWFSTTFAAFGMEAPTAGGGLFAKVHEELGLMVQLDLSQVEGLAVSGGHR